ncbi:hypothetical protein [Streptomyces cucumeris]|uniref:hypothetical protein n=1 Tax=Streptomyces cucumeris TaxID=2962890 RepID=UPI003EB80F81
MSLSEIAPSHPLETPGAPPPPAVGPYEVLDGPLDGAELLDAIRTVLGRQEASGDAPVLVSRGPDDHVVSVAGARLEVRSRPLPDGPPGTLDPVLPAPPRRRVLVSATSTAGPLPERAEALYAALVAEIGLRAHCYTAAEIRSIRNGLPLVERYATPEPALTGWALVFRDHYVENSVGFLLAMERAGLPREWIYALSKGDRTQHRDRVHAWFVRHGYRSDTLDNSVINGTADGTALAHARRVNERVSAFVGRAHAEGRRVLVIDDGGLLAQGYGSDDPFLEHVDAAVELTVSGLKRIAGAPGELTIPVFNMARSQVKTELGYNEIADSCVRRLRAIIPGEKFIGRHVLLLGYGTLGSRTAHALRALGCRVGVVDTDVLTLITAAEDGFETYRSTAEALTHRRPFLIMGGTGELAVTPADLPLLPDGVFLAGFATKDFSLLADGHADARETVIPHVGLHYALPSGKSVTVLGDGRSLNLFEYEGIANRGYDAYRAGTLLAAKRLCRDLDTFPPGVHLDPVNRAIDEAGLFTAYYDRYLCGTAQPPSEVAGHAR